MMGNSPYEVMKITVVLQILYGFIKEMDEKHDFKDRVVILFKAFFELQMLKNKFLSNNTLARLSLLNLGIYNLCQSLVNSQYLFEKADVYFQKQEKSLIKINIEEVISHNIDFQRFYELNQEVSSQLNSFWSRLLSIGSKGTKQEIELLYQEGMNSSEQIHKVVEKFEEIEQKYNKNPFLYYHFACFQKYILNNDSLSRLYFQKMVQIKEIRKVILTSQDSQTILTNVDEAGLLLVKGTFKEFGEIILINNTGSGMVGYDNKYLVSKKINILMPQIISENHHKFWNRFNENGVPSFIERRQHLYMRTIEGYIIPVLAYVKFSQDKAHGHVFVAIINRIKKVLPFREQQEYPYSEVLTFMVDEKNRVVSISKNVNEVIGLSSAVIEQNCQYISEGLQIDQIFDLDVAKLEKAGGEGICFLSNQFKTQVNHQSSLRPQQDRDSRMDSLKVKMIIANYKGLLSIKYFYVAADTQNIEFHSLLSSLSDTSSQNITDFDSSKMENNNNESASTCSSTVTTELKDFVSLLESKKTPKLLRMVVQLISLCFLIMACISSATLIKFIVTCTSNIQDVKVMFNSLERSMQTQRAISCASQYMSLSTTNINPSSYQDVFKLFNLSTTEQLKALAKARLQHSLSEIQGAQQNQVKVSNNILKYANLDYLMNQKSFSLTSISADGTVSAINSTIDIGVNSLIQSAQSLISAEFDQVFSKNFPQIFGSLPSIFNQMKALAINSTTINQYTMTQFAQEYFYFFKNSYRHLTLISSNIALLQQQEVLSVMDSFNQVSLITMLISVGSIFVITLSVVPSFAKIEQRKYKALEFFFILDKDLAKICCLRSEKFEMYFYNELDRCLNEEEEQQKQGMKNLKKSFMDMKTAPHPQNREIGSVEIEEAKSAQSENEIQLQFGFKPANSFLESASSKQIQTQKITLSSFRYQIEKSKVIFVFNFLVQSFNRNTSD